MLSGIVKDFAEKGLTTGSLTKSFLGFSLATMTLSSMGVLGLGLSILPTIFCSLPYLRHIFLSEVCI